jgi:hypothetical protein
METDLEELAESSPVEEQPPSVAYFIDQDWYESNGLSFQDVIQARMCEVCQARAAAGEEEEQRHTVYDAKTRRASFEVRRVPFASNPIKRIREDCSAKKGYITPDMPTLEAVFRVYLLNGNQPMPLSHVREQLVDWCPDGQCRWLLLADGQIERIVANDQFYGIRPFEPPTSK